MRCFTVLQLEIAYPLICFSGMRGGKQVVIEPHRHAGVFIARGKEDALVTVNLVPGESVYAEKRIAVEV